MGVQIARVSTVASAGGALTKFLPFAGKLFKKGALKLADEAAISCLKSAGCHAEEIELLVNVGLYREKNLGEPALASIIQEDIGASSSYQQQGKHGTFSFDLANSAAGGINALHICNRFIQSSTVSKTLIVASDADPGGKRKGFNFPPVGAALLLSVTEEDEGFEGFYFRVYPEFEHMMSARMGWKERTFRLPFMHEGFNFLEMYEEETYIDSCVACAKTSTLEFLEKRGLSISDIDLVISSQYPRAFPNRLEKEFMLSDDCVVKVSQDKQGAWTAGIFAALEAAIKSGRFAKAKTILFVAVGSGISTSLALYKKNTSVL